MWQAKAWFLKSIYKFTRPRADIRLHEVVRTWPRADIAKAIGDLSRRAKLLYKAKCKLFDGNAEI